jgi:hypothetical protein
VRALAEYQLADWAKAVPLVHGLKRMRNVAVERTFRSMYARGYDRFIAELAALKPQTLAISVAYNTPWVIDVTTRLTGQNLVGTLAICDNSRIHAVRIENERICKERGVPYLPLPVNLERHPCRHHGITLNWVYYNVVDRVRPRVFGFLDHDLFALKRFDLAALVANEPVYGVCRTGPWGWSLWAGFCVYDRAAIAGFFPDFNNDLPRRLDTGGRNWVQIYRHLDRERLRFAAARSAVLRVPGDGEELAVELIDDCLLHVGGASFWHEPHRSNIEAPYRRVLRHLDAGGTLAELMRHPTDSVPA